MATSKYFSAELGGLDQDLQQQLEAWMGSQYANASLLTSDGGATLLAESKSERTAKSHKMSIRNVWKKLGFAPDFLKLLSADDFQHAMGQAGGHEQASDTQSCVELPRLWGVDALGWYTSLSPGFDQRAEEIFAKLSAAAPAV